MLAVALLMPLAIAVLAIVLLPVGGMYLLFSATDMTAGAYPFYYAGHFGQFVGRDPIRALDWRVSVPITIGQWILVALIFSRYAGHLSARAQLVAASVVYFVAVVVGKTVCDAIGVQLVWEWTHM